MSCNFIPFAGKMTYYISIIILLYRRWAFLLYRARGSCLQEENKWETLDVGHDYNYTTLYFSLPLYIVLAVCVHDASDDFF